MVKRLFEGIKKASVTPIASFQPGRKSGLSKVSRHRSFAAGDDRDLDRFVPSQRIPCRAISCSLSGRRQGANRGRRRMPGRAPSTLTV